MRYFGQSFVFFRVIQIALRYAPLPPHSFQVFVKTLGLLALRGGIADDVHLQSVMVVGFDGPRNHVQQRKFCFLHHRQTGYRLDVDAYIW